MQVPVLEGDGVPVNPFRTRLHDQAELLGTFEVDDPLSYGNTVDFTAYQNYPAHGRSTRAPYLRSIVRAIHDNSIAQAVRRFAHGRKIVGVMGGHKLSRSSASYRNIVLMAKRLAEADMTLASGGGPGAMEATHVGAGLGGSSDDEAQCPATKLDHGQARRRNGRPAFLDRETMADQHLTHDVISAVDHDVDGSKPGLTGVSKPALDDMCNPVGSCVGHDDRVESCPVAPVGCDHCSFWATEVIEPEELTEIVGRMRGAPPPPLQIGGFQ